MKLKFYQIAFCTLALLTLSVVNTFAQVRAWGYNASGQTGDGNQIDLPTPVNIGLEQTTGFGGGYLHTLFLQADGTILAVGYNYYGALGDGSITTTGCYCKTTPVTVSGISTATQVAGGADHSLALLADGTVKAWGNNIAGELGDGTTVDKLTPVTVSGLTNVVAIQAGAYHSLALENDGTVWAWGYNNNGQLGDNSIATRLTPVQVSGLTNVIAVTSGDYYSMALKSDGTVWVWGNNTYGQVGNNTFGVNALVPTQTTITGVSQISAGAYHNIALKPDGSVWIWGNNDVGQVGNGTATGSQYIPVQNMTLTNVIDVTTDGYTNYVRRRDGTVWAWGYNNVGEIGNGTTTPVFPNAVTTPVQSSVGMGNALLGAAYYHAFIANPSVTTGAGMNRILRGDNVKLAFSNVTNSGTTYFTAVDPTSAIITNLTLPSGYIIENNEPAYNITTTATFTGNVETCVQLTGEYDPVKLNKLRLLHGEGGNLVDRSSSINFQTRVICATTTSLSPFVVAQTLNPTAANVSISGRVLSNGRGLANARVELRSLDGTTRTINTNSFGNFTFDEVEAGATYVVNVSAKQYTFAPQVISVNEDISDLTFTAQ